MRSDCILLFAGALLVGCGTSVQVEQAVQAPSVKKESAVGPGATRILFSGQMEGEIEPCG
jgi:hypothetical protein